MKKLFFLFFALFFGLSAGFLSCENNDDNDKNESLYVKFINNADSEYTITRIEVQPMGIASESNEPTGEWSENVLTGGETIAPGGHVFFTLPIPNLNWSRYRLGVDDGQGNEILLYEQEGYNEGNLPITHWGSDERTVTITIYLNSSTSIISISAWGDNAGIGK